MKTRWFRTGLAALALCLAVTVQIGCAKKGEMQNSTQVIQAQEPSTKPTTGGAAGQASGDRTLQKPGGLQEETLRDKTKGQTGVQTTQTIDKPKEMSAKEKEAAVLKELQIPDILFEYDRYVLTPAAQEVLKNYAPAFQKYKEYTLVVEGHCDERGTVEYNLALGEERASQTAKYLVSLGIERQRIKTISYGKERPLDPGHNESAWAKNRRAHFIVATPGK